MGPLRPIRWANERKRKLRQWETGVPSYSSLFIGWGTVLVRKGYGGKPFTQLRTASGVYVLRWFAGVCPPEVKTGTRQVVVGRIGTMNMGREVLVTDALVLDGLASRRGFKKSLTALFARTVLEPKKYMDWPDEWRELTPPG